MSLKAFHIAFIIASIFLSIFFAVWSFQEYSLNLRPAFLVSGIGGMVAGVSLVFYLLWFIKKIKNVRILGLMFAMVAASGSRSALACAVCIGDQNSIQVQSANAAVLFLLVVISIVLTAFGSLFLVWRKRALRLGSEY